MLQTFLESVLESKLQKAVHQSASRYSLRLPAGCPDDNAMQTSLLPRPDLLQFRHRPKWYKPYKQRCPACQPEPYHRQRKCPVRANRWTYQCPVYECTGDPATWHQCAAKTAILPVGRNHAVPVLHTMPVHSVPWKVPADPDLPFPAVSGQCAFLQNKDTSASR